jgi:hypothetical protein
MPPLSAMGLRAANQQGFDGLVGEPGLPRGHETAAAVVRSARGGIEIERMSPCLLSGQRHDRFDECLLDVVRAANRLGIAVLKAADQVDGIAQLRNRIAGAVDGFLAVLDAARNGNFVCPRGKRLALHGYAARILRIRRHE